MRPEIWQPHSWRLKSALQQPAYTDQQHLQAVEAQLAGMPAMVFADEIRQLKQHLALAAQGKAFLLQGGDCAESFRDFSDESIRELFRVFMQMAVVLTYAGSKPVIKVGRIAGQFAKPRSVSTETVDGVELPSFRGDIINGLGFDAQSRKADPERMLQAYHQSTATINLMRAYAQGGMADLHQVNQWNKGFVAGNPACERYQSLAEQIHNALAFMDACGINSGNTPALKETTMYTSHEALLLNYEQALTRFDSQTEQWYSGSAHMLWIGERTRQLDGSHVEFVRGLANPIGIKISQHISNEDLIRLIDRINPDNQTGRITLINRMGADAIQQHLPRLAETVAKQGRSVVWSCDPMHGNTISATEGLKTRSFDRIVTEIQCFFEVLHANNQQPSGLHLEMTGSDVTECYGGAYEVAKEDLADRYLSQCDPRLNALQVLELSFQVAKWLNPSCS